MRNIKGFELREREQGGTTRERERETLLQTFSFFKKKIIMQILLHCIYNCKRWNPPAALSDEEKKIYIYTSYLSSDDTKVYFLVWFSR
jgi:hypothetical protein